jgi:hypothetical protein
MQYKGFLKVFLMTIAYPDRQVLLHKMPRTEHVGYFIYFVTVVLVILGYIVSFKFPSVQSYMYIMYDYVLKPILISNPDNGHVLIHKMPGTENVGYLFIFYNSSSRYPGR